MTEPEPINHNELKRLLQECFEDVINELGGPVPPFLGASNLKRRIKNKIDNAILDGDDS